MKIKNPIERLQNEMQASGCDARAEVQLLMGLENGLYVEDFMAGAGGLFCREYNRDVRSAEIKDDASGLPVLQLHLTRSGIYDHLPEGLFFQPAQVSGRITGAAEMAIDHRFNKQRETEIRRFFQPFDNDFFLQRLAIESEETKLLEGLRTGILDDYFMNFWGIPESVPQRFIAPLILMLPYANKISADLFYTTQCLEQLLQEEVCIRKKPALETPTNLRFNCYKTDLRLGVDMVCGDCFKEDYTVLECSIGPLKNSQICDYLEGGNRFSLLQTFYALFLPADADISTNIEAGPERKGLLLDTDAAAVLGYSSFL